MKTPAVILLIILIGGCIGDSPKDNVGTSTNYDWESDGISLMQHESEGYYGCFGCSTSNEGPAMCIDPIMEMKLVEESEQRHCNSNFEVVEAN